jgi:hypothetical protein
MVSSRSSSVSVSLERPIAPSSSASPVSVAQTATVDSDLIAACSASPD